MKVEQGRGMDARIDQELLGHTATDDAGAACTAHGVAGHEAEGELHHRYLRGKGDWGC